MIFVTPQESERSLARHVLALFSDKKKIDGANGLPSVKTLVSRLHYVLAMRHSDNRRNGQPFDARGGVDPSHVPTAEEYARVAAELGRHEDRFLGYQVFIQKDERAEFW
jgi:hypothetical protein